MNSENQLRSARNEFAILNRLKHEHVVTVLDIYQHKNRLNIIMIEVADSDLAEFMLDIDTLPSENQLDQGKDALRTKMLAWPGCLIQAIDYLHEMRVKHKDIKPANILIMRGKVLLADFGISKDLIDQETTAFLNSNRDIGTPMYCAPEVLSENHRRGRAADIFSLGCVFLEISTVLLGPQPSLEKWSRHRELSGSRLNSTSASQILQWLRYLWAHCVAQFRAVPEEQRVVAAKDSPAWQGIAPADMSFLMLDPDPNSRITAQQMVSAIQTPNSSFFNRIGMKSCASCRAFPISTSPSLPIHSRYKPLKTDDFPLDPDDILCEEAMPSWEEAKSLWLENHMW